MDYLAAPDPHRKYQTRLIFGLSVRGSGQTKKDRATITNTNQTLSQAKWNTVEVQPGQPQQQEKCLRDASCEQMVLIAIQISPLKSHFIVESVRSLRPNLFFMTVWTAQIWFIIVVNIYLLSNPARATFIWGPFQCLLCHWNAKRCHNCALEEVGPLQLNFNVNLKSREGKNAFQEKKCSVFGF